MTTPFGAICLWETDQGFQSVLSKIRGRTLVDTWRCWMLGEFAGRAARGPGDIAEVGVYKGGTAFLLASVAPGKTLHCFDTFAGMPRVCDKDNHHRAGDFGDTSLESVASFLSEHQNIRLYQGRFPDTVTPEVGALTFSMVHVDVDIYVSVIDCCEYFWPRLVSGGVMVFDDYGFRSCEGAKIAVDEFAARSGIKTIYLPTGQAIFLKT